MVCKIVSASNNFKNMKKNVLALLFVGFGVQFFFGQESLSLKLRVDTDKTVNETEHFYLMEIVNTTSTGLQFSISIDNTECEYINANKQVTLNQTVLNVNKTKVNNPFNVAQGESLEFYIRLNRPIGTELDTWNCSKIIAKSQTGEILSNPVVIKTLIPDPTKFN